MLYSGQRKKKQTTTTTNQIKLIAVSYREFLMQMSKKIDDDDTEMNELRIKLNR